MFGNDERGRPFRPQLLARLAGHASQLLPAMHAAQKVKFGRQFPVQKFVDKIGVVQDGDQDQTDGQPSRQQRLEDRGVPWPAF